MAQSASTLNKVQRQNIVGSDTDPLTVYDARQMQSNLADTIDKIVTFLSISPVFQLLSLKDQPNGYAGLTSAGLIKVAELLGLAPSFTTLDISGAAPGTPVAQRIYKESVLKAWVYATVSGGAVTVKAGLNVSSITYVAVGRYKLNFATNLTDANYAAALGVYKTGNAVIAEDNTAPVRSVSQYAVEVANSTTGADTEATSFSVIITDG